MNIRTLLDKNRRIVLSPHERFLWLAARGAYDLMPDEEEIDVFRGETSYTVR